MTEKLSGFIFVSVEPDWIAEFAKKQELVQKANKLKVIKCICINKHVLVTM